MDDPEWWRDWMIFQNLKPYQKEILRELANRDFKNVKAIKVPNNSDKIRGYRADSIILDDGGMYSGSE